MTLMTQFGRDTFDLSNFESLQIIKGASSSVHGSGAIGGVVILESSQPGDFLKDKDSTPMFPVLTPISATSTKARVT